MAVDGIVTETRKHENRESKNTNAFRNRKQCYGIIVIAGVDADLRFMVCSAKCPESTNDCIAWELSRFYKDVIQKTLFPNNYYIIGDVCFVNTYNFFNSSFWN